MRRLLVISLCSFPITSNCLSSDQYLPYHVTADQMTYYRLQHTTTYVGHVFATQGTTELDGDKIIVFHDPKTHAIRRIIATGHPAHYHTLPDHEKALLAARADTIKYNPIKAEVWLLANATVNFKQDVFIGPHIWYNMKKQMVVSTGYHDKVGTTIIVEPQNVTQHANLKR